MIQNNVLNNVDSEITWYKFEKYSASYNTTYVYQDTEPTSWSDWTTLVVEDVDRRTNQLIWAYSSYSYSSNGGFLADGNTTYAGWNDSKIYDGDVYRPQRSLLTQYNTLLAKLTGNVILKSRTKTATYTTINNLVISSTLESTIQSPSELYPQQEELGYTFVENTTVNNINYIIMKDSSNQLWAFKKVNQ